MQGERSLDPLKNVVGDFSAHNIRLPNGRACMSVEQNTLLSQVRQLRTNTSSSLTVLLLLTRTFAVSRQQRSDS